MYQFSIDATCIETSLVKTSALGTAAEKQLMQQFCLREHKIQQSTF
jgi:hypothetical protein